jgi:NADP-dependent 3-hydroxy acid dehydrogenase YdfG
MPPWNDPTRWSLIVTGGSSGLGAATCARLRNAGASVVSLDRRPATATADGDAVDTEVVDLADPDATAAATERAVERLGGVDAVVCSAGVDAPGQLLDTDPKEWRNVIDVNLGGTVSVVRAALPSLLDRQGRIVTVASTLAHKAVSDATAYCASKFAVVGFSRALTAELRGRVGVTMLTPGGMSTAFFDGRTEQYKPPADAVLADPADVAEAILWSLGRPEGLEVRELAVMSAVEGSWP